MKFLTHEVSMTSTKCLDFYQGSIKIVKSKVRMRR